MPASSNSFSPASSAISVVSTFASPTATDARGSSAAEYVEVLYKLFGGAARLPHAHPAARFRDIEQVKRDAEPVADYA